MEIKHSFSDTTLCSFEVATIREAAEQGKSKLHGADLGEADLCGADLREADLCGANLCNAKLYGADLRGADLRRADLYGANLCEANLSAANLRGADLHRADLYGANLCEADLRGARLYGARLYGADLRGANLDGEKIEKNPLVVVGLTYWCLISDNYMRLGCKRFTHAEWAEFDDKQIAAMDSRALEFWSQWKAPLLAMCAAHKPT